MYICLNNILNKCKHVYMYIYVFKYIYIYMDSFTQTYAYKNVCIYILICI